jgi:hypothetical protein
LTLPIVTEATAAVRTVSLWFAAIAILIFGVAMDTGDHDREALCGGRLYARVGVPNGTSPYIELTADAATGPFLLDYGATRSSLSAEAFGGAEGSPRRASISLPGIEQGDFHLARYGLLRQPEKGQLGVIGANLLSRLTVQLTANAAYLGVQPCRRETLIARGLVPISQDGFFSSEPPTTRTRLPNVPVVFVRLGDVRAFAQIDTGYEDAVYAHSVDINQALFDRLVQSGIKLDKAGDVDIWTCDGRERRPRYAVRDRALGVEDEQSKTIAQIDDFHLIVKPPDACGGIADMTEPAAQLGASFLRLFGTVVFDPKNGTVWLDGAVKSRQGAPDPARVR